MSPYLILSTSYHGLVCDLHRWLILSYDVAMEFPQKLTLASVDSIGATFGTRFKRNGHSSISCNVSHISAIAFFARDIVVFMARFSHAFSHALLRLSPVF